MNLRIGLDRLFAQLRQRRHHLLMVHLLYGLVLFRRHSIPPFPLHLWGDPVPQEGCHPAKRDAPRSSIHRSAQKKKFSEVWQVTSGSSPFELVINHSFWRCADFLVSAMMHVALIARKEVSAM